MWGTMCSYISTFSTKHTRTAYLKAAAWQQVDVEAPFLYAQCLISDFGGPGGCSVVCVWCIVYSTVRPSRF
jgi:hypothetical protein